MIDTTKNFEKYIGSFKKAYAFINQFAEENGVSLRTNLGGGVSVSGVSVTKRGRSILQARGENELFSFCYYGSSKTIAVWYKDNRELPQETKYPYYYIWIEGLTPERGEKISKVTDKGFEYTTKITEAIRIKRADRERFKDMLIQFQIADWCAESVNTFVPTSYAPKGTLYNF